MEEVIEILREKLHKALENGNSDEILKASMDLDIEIVRLMTTTACIAHSFEEVKFRCGRRM